jgi:hypothetical protein
MSSSRSNSSADSSTNGENDVVIQYEYDSLSDSFYESDTANSSDGSTSDADDNSSDNSYDLYELYEYIDEIEYEFNERDKVEGQYVLGLPAYVEFIDNTLDSETTKPILGCGISTRTFYHYSYAIILKYLVANSVLFAKYLKQPSIHIIKIHIDSTNTYIALLKTHWLRLVQRHWKKAFNERKHILCLRKQPNSIFHFARRGRYPDGQNVCPTIHGLMRMYNKKRVVS